MTIHVRDYAHLDSADRKTGKFVVLEKAGGLHLVLATLSETPYHFQIVDRYLREQGVCLAMGDPDHVDFGQSGWRGRGGGHFDWKPPSRTLLLYGKSFALGRYDRELLKPLGGAIAAALGELQCSVELG